MFFVEERGERNITDILYSRHLAGRYKHDDKITFIIDEAYSLDNSAIPNIVRGFCQQNNIPYIITSTPYHYLQQEVPKNGIVEVIELNDIKLRCKINSEQKKLKEDNVRKKRKFL